MLCITGSVGWEHTMLRITSSVVVHDATLLKSHSFSVWVSQLFKKNCSDRARRVVHSSPCCLFLLVHAESRRRNSAAIVIMPLAIVVLPWARCNYFIILTDYSS